jgi:medium-chain acyl-[acyl-carrier-protein] hydrolase
VTVIVTSTRTAAVKPWWHSRLKRNAEATVRLFCFPYAGSAANIFRTWQSSFPSAVEVIPIELPGRGTRWNEPPFRRLGYLVDAILQAIKGLLDKPFALFGHSMGGLLSYELAQCLREQHGLEPAHLFVSGCAAPHLIEGRDKLYRLPDSEFLGKIKAYKGTSDEILENRELMQLLLPVLRADSALVDTYVYRASAPLSCPITSFGGSEDAEVSLDDVRAWKVHTRGVFLVHIMAGDHFFINTRQDELLCLLGRKLEGIARREG